MATVTSGSPGLGRVRRQDLPHTTVTASMSNDNVNAILITAAADGVAVRFKSGAYTLTSLAIPAGSYLFGDGDENTIIGTSTSGTFATVGGHRVTIKAMAFEQSNGTPQGKGLVAAEKYWLRTENLVLTGFDVNAEFSKAIYHRHIEPRWEFGNYGARFIGDAGTWNTDWYNNVIAFINPRFTNNGTKGFEFLGVGLVLINPDASICPIGFDFAGQSSTQKTSSVHVISPYFEGTDDAFRFSYADGTISNGVAYGGALETPKDILVDASNYSIVTVDNLRTLDYWTTKYKAASNSKINAVNSQVTFGSTDSVDSTSLLVGDVFGSWTATLVGCTTSPTATVKYAISGKVVTLSIPAMSGTSNATGMSLTGMPTSILPATQQNQIATCINDGSDVTGRIVINSSALNFYPNLAYGNFEVTGVKGFGALNFSYVLG